MEATPAIIPIEDEVFGPLIEEMQSLIGTYSDRELTTVRDFLDRASAVIGRSGPGVAPAPRPPDPRPSRSNSRRPRLPGSP